MNMRNTLTKSALAIALLAAGSAAFAANVGHYEICSEGPNPNAVNAITTAGHTPVAVNAPDAATLGGLDVLFVTNCNNGGSSAEYTNNFGNIAAAVNAGMTLMVHDRWVTGGASLVPGSSGIVFSRDFNDPANIDLPTGSPVISGPGGVLDNTSLDGGSSSSHGFVDATTLPAGSQVLAHRSSPLEAVTVAYGVGMGAVVYSTIPLDFYLNGSSPLAFRDIYAPNVIGAYPFDVRAFSSCAGEGYTGDQLKLCTIICNSSLTGKPITPLVRLWTSTFGDDPLCPSATAPLMVP